MSGELSLSFTAWICVVIVVKATWATPGPHPLVTSRIGLRCVGAISARVCVQSSVPSVARFCPYRSGGRATVALPFAPGGQSRQHSTFRGQRP
ncbi:Hypothetical protein NTJ_13121 [Nesidiocoris tenuis]|uniref:Secreted protein n=1 Tax=Nesidiocoris tenuis TaxID=355587 RepID=A0ABN7B9L6_9HEMI|nr:Hypothetical protein NTJ_13121 [Nesidiocoris tenuis]